MFGLLNHIFRRREARRGAAPASVTAPAAAAAAIERGNQYLAAEEYEAALAHYQDAQANDPACLDAYVCQAFACRALGRPAQARAMLRHVLAQNARHADAHYMLAGLDREANDLPSARQHLHVALSAQPHLQPAYGELTEILVHLQQLAEAQQTVARGLALFPEDAGLHFFHGNVQTLLGASAAAAASYRQAIFHQENFGAALMGLGTSLCSLGDFEQAIVCIQQALALEPGNAAWYSSLLFAMQYRRDADPMALFRLHQDYANRFEQPLLGRPMSSMTGRDLPARLRVGYVSGDFRGHSLAYFIEPVLRMHDRQSVEVFCYYTYPTADHITARLQGTVEHWRSCAGMSDEAMAQAIVEDRIDILVDLSGHTAYNRLLVFARKPAPIQMTWLGYQSTTGLRSMDYRITDAGLDPPGHTEHLHSEKLLRLGMSGVFQPEPGSPAVNALPCLGGERFTFGCLNNTGKMSGEFLATAAGVLHAAPGSLLLLGGMTEESEHLVCTQLAIQGIDRDRLVLVRHQSTIDYLRLHHRIDLALDTFPYNGGTTSMHSLWMGVPVLALEGDTPISRVGASLMCGLQLPDFVCTSREAYVRQAAAWASNPEGLQVVRAGLRARMQAVLLDQARTMTAELEAAFRRVFQEALESPDSGP